MNIPYHKLCNNGDTCLLCNDDYYSFEDNPYECVLSSTQINGYYKDDSNKIFLNCVIIYVSHVTPKEQFQIINAMNAYMDMRKIP